ncbi:MAG TPA: outer membrane lipid asymmetry maintenance protein MlaD [Steroidobacteraceae bacterium]|jgi:phospholipid/cholesterol/gamma-HCH transport system substrate-binding protein|nr:outer membrane lipid asymmetry maintenance protein MlaD [Steroidobacteraceae bacterium]
MRSNRGIEIGTGLFVVLGFIALLFLTTQLPSSGLKLASTKAGYHISAAFDNVGDLKVGSPVTMAGVNLGEVESIRIDWTTYKANVSMRIDPQYNKIPDDSDASIQTQGLLGGKYVGIGAGGSNTFLKEGSQITLTQSALVLENLINKFFTSQASKGADSGSSGSTGGDTGSSAPKKESAK